MKSLSWQEIRNGLRQFKATPTPPPAAAFWSEFSARQTLHPQVPTRTAAQIAVGWYAHRWLWGAAAGLLICSLAVFSLMPHTAVPPKTTTETVTGAVVSVDVKTNYTSVMIVQDKMNRGTVVCFAGLQ